MAAASPAPLAATAELCFVDIASALSRLEVQLSRDIDSARHAQAAAQLRGLTRLGGGSDAGNGDVPTTGGGGGFAPIEGCGAEVESQGEMSSFRSSVAPPATGGAGRGAVHAVPASIPRRIRELRAARQ